MTNSLSVAMFNQSNMTFTENGAPAFHSTGSGLLDFFSRAGTLRNNQSEILKLFKDAFFESPEASIVLAFALRDARGGGKERLSFKTILEWLYKNEEEWFNKIVRLVPEYGYWKDILSFTDSELVQNIVAVQLATDALSTHPSLLAKWMPSANAGKASRKLALKWMKLLNVDEPEYRRSLSAIRAYIAPVENYMSAGKWFDIDFSRVTSVAMKNYGKAFGRHNQAGFEKYLLSVAKGEVKINAATLFPHDLVNKCIYNHKDDAVVEAQWKALPDFTDGENVIVMPDTSGSMMTGVLGNVTAYAISISLGIYFAQRNKGAFHNQMVTFSRVPKFISLKDSMSLREAVQFVGSYSEAANTDLMAAITQILEIAKKNNVPQSDMPTKLLILSDMQFDRCTNRPDDTTFSAMKKEFAKYGYEMPNIVFWNLGAYGNSPVTKNDLGVALVSGASPASLQYVLGKIASPLETMLRALNSERYEAVRKALV